MFFVNLILVTSQSNEIIETNIKILCKSFQNILNLVLVLQTAANFAIL